MQRILIALVVIVTAVAFSSCSKDGGTEDTILSGTWIKGTNVGDTLYFTNNNGKSVLRYNASFNTAPPFFTETEYNYWNGKLSLRNFMAAQNEFYLIQSFHWTQTGKQFDVLGYQLFPFMSSTTTVFTFKKIN